MDELTLEIFASGPLLNNCYLIFNRKSKAGCLIDSPWNPEELKIFLKNQNIEILFILLTHAHFDHIAGLNNLDKPFYVHKDDLILLNDFDVNGSFLFGSPIVAKKAPQLYPKRGLLPFGNIQIKVIHTPGHTPGSVCLELNHWLFSGDTLFYDSVGRTDVPLASAEKLRESIQKKLLILPEDTAVYPGHGPQTTIGREKKHNPFLCI